jgi:hypothetical protein
VIYFENAVWHVVESEYEHVYNAWMALWNVLNVNFGNVARCTATIVSSVTA